MKLKLSDETIQTLKKLYTINQTLKIRGGNPTVKSINETKTLACYATIEEEFPRDFCVYDLGEFIGVLNIVDHPVLDLSNDNYVVIESEDGRQKLRYIETSPEMITSFFDKELSLKSEDIEFDVEQDALKTVMKSAGALKLPFVGFRCDGEKVYLTTFDRRTDSDDRETNALTIEIGECDTEFDIFYPTEIMRVISDNDCVFTFAKGQQISRVECGDKVFWIAMDKDSEIQ